MQKNYLTNLKNFNISTNLHPSINTRLRNNIYKKLYFNYTIQILVMWLSSVNKSTQLHYKIK